MIRKPDPFILILGILIGAIGYWKADFSEEKALFESVFYFKAPGSFLVALMAGLLRKKQPAWNAVLISFGVLFGMLTRILSDMVIDPGSHNLFPFELLTGLIIVLPVSFFGAYLIHIIFYLSGKS
jgi:hypothetical protein